MSSGSFSPDGQYILIGSKNEAKLFQIDGTEILSFSGDTWNLSSVSFLPNGQYILTGFYRGTGYDGSTAKLLNLQGEEIGNFTYEAVSSVAFSPDGQYLSFSSGSLMAPIKDFDIYRIKADGSGKAINLTGKRTGSFRYHVWRR